MDSEVHLEPPTASPGASTAPVHDEDKTSTPDTLAPEEGFEISLFCSPLICLKFRGDLPFTIHRTLLLKSSTLALLCDATTKSLDLSHISNGAGHILVQYLYTGTYQGLKWTGTPRPDATVGRFKTAVEVYAAARQYGLDGLEELAKEEIEKEGTNLNAFTVIDAVKDAYPTPTKDDVWFPDYMKSRIKAAFQEPADLMSAPFQIDFGEPMSIAKVVFRGMLEVYCEMLESLTRGTSEITEAPKPVTEQPPDHDANPNTPREKHKPVSEEVEDCAPLLALDGKTVLSEVTRGHHLGGTLLVEESRLPLRSESDPADSAFDMDVRRPLPEEQRDHGQSVTDNLPLIETSSPLPVVESSVLPVTREPEPIPVVKPDTIPESKQWTPPLSQPKPDHDPRPETGGGGDFPKDESNNLPLGAIPEILPSSQEIESISERTTPSPARDGDGFWESLSKRRKERIGIGRRTTVTFDIPGQEPVGSGGQPGGPGVLGKKGSELSGTAPEFVPRSHIFPSVGGGLEPSPFGPELASASLTHQPLSVSDRFTTLEREELEPATFFDVKEPFRQDLVVAPIFSPRSDPGINDVPELIPPDPNIWGPIGSHISKSKTNTNVTLSEEPTHGAQLDRDLDLTTPEPITPSNEKWESWGGRLSSAKTSSSIGRKRTLSMSLSLNAFTTADLKDPDSKPRPVSSLWSIRSRERLDTSNNNNNTNEPALIDEDNTNGGARATPDPDPDPSPEPLPEPTSGATLAQDDTNNPWDQPSSSSPPPQSQSPQPHSLPRKKRSKRSRRLRALAEEQGMGLISDAAHAGLGGRTGTHAVDGDLAGSDVLSQSTADEREQTSFEERSPSSRGSRQGQGTAGESRAQQQQQQARTPPPPQQLQLLHGRESNRLGAGQEQQQQQQHDPWEFWGARKSPPSRKTF